MTRSTVALATRASQRVGIVRASQRKSGNQSPKVRLAK
jgi:hypothetical protein